MTVSRWSRRLRRGQATSKTTNRPPPAGNPNLLLAALPAADYARIAPTLTVLPLKLKQILHKPGERIQYVYFPAAGFCSMLATLEDGAMVEVATIGRQIPGQLSVLDLAEEVT